MPRSSNDLLKEFLSERSTPCPSCGYDLRNLTGSSCPECGQRLQLSVTLVYHNLPAYVVGLVSIGMSLGYSAIASGFILFASLNGRLRNPSGAFVVCIVLTLLISIALLVVWIRISHWLRRQSPFRRWTLATACVALPIMDMALLIAIGPR